MNSGLGKLFHGLLRDRRRAGITQVAFSRIFGGFSIIRLKPTLLLADGKRWLLADPCDFFRVDHLSALHQLTRVPLASALAAACDFVL